MTKVTLGRSDCLRLLAGHGWGRVAFSERALPSICPLPYTLVGDSLVLSTGSDGLGRTLDGQIVAFEVDDMNPLLGTGWLVVVTGSARLRTRPADLARPSGRAARPGDASRQTSEVTVIPGEIAGRRTQ